MLRLNILLLAETGNEWKENYGIKILVYVM